MSRVAQFYPVPRRKLIPGIRLRASRCKPEYVEVTFNSGDDQWPEAITAANFPQQTVYTFAAAARILGRHVTTLFRQAREGLVKTVDTPVGRRIHIDEIRRQSGEEPERRLTAHERPHARQAAETHLLK